MASQSLKEFMLDGVGETVYYAACGLAKFRPGDWINSAIDQVQPWRVEIERRPSDDHTLACRVRRHRNSDIRKIEIGDNSCGELKPYIIADSYPVDDKLVYRGYGKLGNVRLPIEDGDTRTLLEKFGLW